jgi:GNAT superfamily N-acetyltransferase
MKSWNIHVSTEEESAYIDDKIVEFNKSTVPFTQEPDFVPLKFSIQDEHDTIIAGINAVLYCWKILYIDVLFVDENHRGKQLGTALLTKVETEAKTRGAQLAHLDTFDWQSKDFYLKSGYEVFGVLENCPEGHTRYYLKKNLGSE